MSARPGQAYACVTGTCRELQQSGGRRTWCQRWGRWHLISPVTVLRTSDLLLASSLKQELPTSLHPPCPWQSTQPSMPCQPMNWERLYHGSIPSATCLLPLFIECHWPATGLCSQAPGFQSALWEADRRLAGLEEASLSHSHHLLAQGLDVGTSARNPDGNCCHLIMHAYDISQII